MFNLVQEIALRPNEIMLTLVLAFVLTLVIRLLGQKLRSVSQEPILRLDNPPAIWVWRTPLMTSEDEEYAVDRIIRDTVGQFGPRIIAAFHRLQVKNPNLPESMKNREAAKSIAGLLGRDDLVRAYERAFDPEMFLIYDLDYDNSEDFSVLCERLDAADEIACSNGIMETVHHLGPAGMAAFKRMQGNGKYLLSIEVSIVDR